MRKSAVHKSASRLTDWEAARARIERQITINPETGCHVWTGSLVDGAYGQVGLEGMVWSVHRLAYELKNGPIPPPDKCKDGRYWVLHSCDNPPCCNPDHLYLGTPADNAKDMADRCRVRVGYMRTDDPKRPNRRYGTVYWEVGGEVLPLKEWAKRLGVNISTLDQRLSAGWPRDMLDAAPKWTNRDLAGKSTYRRFSGVVSARQAAGQSA